MSVDNQSSQFEGSYIQGSLRPGSTLHSSLSNSLLLQPTGRILRHRIREETKQKVRESTQNLEDRLRVHNRKIRREFENKFTNRIRKFEAHRHEETKKWELKTAHSPFHTDLLKADAELFEKICKVRSEKERLQRKYDKLEAMRGKPKYDIVSDDVIEKASSEIAQLALQRRVIQGDLQVTQREFAECDKMLYDEFHVLERKFPAIRDKLMQSREGGGSLFGGGGGGGGGVSRSACFSASSSLSSPLKSSLKSKDYRNVSSSGAEFERTLQGTAAGGGGGGGVVCGSSLEEMEDAGDAGEPESRLSRGKRATSSRSSSNRGVGSDGGGSQRSSASRDHPFDSTAAGGSDHHR